jgi:hypothetical protein
VKRRGQLPCAHARVRIALLMWRTQTWRVRQCRWGHVMTLGRVVPINARCLESTSRQMRAESEAYVYSLSVKHRVLPSLALN